MLKSYKTKLLVCMLLLLSLIFGSFSVLAETKNERKIIIFNDGVSRHDQEQILKKNGIAVSKTLDGINGVIGTVPSTSNIDNDSGILFVEDDVVLSIDGKISKSKKDTMDKNNTRKNGKDKINNVNNTNTEEIPWGIKYMGAPTQWSTNSGENIKVGIIDTGVDETHPDLVSNIAGGINVINETSTVSDDNGHGTHVAGIIAATDNEIGVIGMAPKTELYAIKALNSTGNGYLSDIIEGINWCIDNNIDIINMSFGMQTDSEILHDAIIRASEAGITLVAAAGNNYGESSQYPATYNEVISVGAINANGEIADFSAQGGVDVYAPGVSIKSTYLADEYIEMDGTSMAAPHIVGDICIHSQN